MRWPVSVKAVAGNQRPTLFVVDLLKHREFLIDLGSEVSLILAHYSDKVQATMGPALVAANDQAIRTYGSRDVNLKFGKFRFSWRFIITDTQIPILGADFLLGNSLAVDLTHHCLFRWHNPTIWPKPILSGAWSNRARPSPRWQ